MQQLLTLWTIQTADAWRTAQRRGVLRGDGRRATLEFRAPFGWMTRQMRVRVGAPTRRTRVPVWAWFHDAFTTHRRPDLRTRGHLPPGTLGVLVRFRADPAHVLLSDFDAWHYVLNYWYLGGTRERRRFQKTLRAAGLDYYETKPLPDPAAHAAIERSWERIFDLEWSRRVVRDGAPPHSIQASLWEVPVAWVNEVTHFVAR